MEWENEDISEADFSLGSLDLSSEADFSLGLDFSFDDNDQVGGRHGYTIHRVHERRIEKFQVYGYDYNVHVEAFDRNLDFTHAVQLLHGVLTGWYIFIDFLLSLFTVCILSLFALFHRALCYFRSIARALHQC